MIFKKIQYNSPVILSFAIISFFVLILGKTTGDVSTLLLFSVYRGTLKSALFWLRLFGHVLGHSTVEHYFNNMLIILLIGPVMEEKYGSKNVLLMIVFTALLTGILHVLISDKILLGSSGIVFMLILLSSFVNFQKGRIPLTLLLIAGMYIGSEIYGAFLLNDNVSRITHIFGGVCGSAFGFWVNRTEEG